MSSELSRVGPIYWKADIFGRNRYQYIGIGKWGYLYRQMGISVSAILDSASVSATLDIGYIYIDMGEILSKIHGYRHISPKTPVID